MSKRRREIKKRKRLVEEAKAEESLRIEEPFEDEVTTEEDEPTADPDRDDLPPVESPIDDSQIVSTPASTPARGPVRKAKTEIRQPKAKTEEDFWFGRNKENFLLGLLILYVLLLGLGTAGELFEIEWILNLPLFR